MAAEIVNAGNPLTEEDIALVEQRIGRDIPPSYKRFLLVHNGGYPEPSCFQMVDKQLGRTEWGCVDWFLGVSDEVSNNLERYVETFRDRLPSQLFPIAHDAGGNLICISTLGSDEGTVYFWDHEFEADYGEVPTYDNVYFIDDNFEKFLLSLKDEE